MKRFVITAEDQPLLMLTAEELVYLAFRVKDKPSMLFTCTEDTFLAHPVAERLQRILPRLTPNAQRVLRAMFRASCRNLAFGAPNPSLAESARIAKQCAKKPHTTVVSCAMQFLDCALHNALVDAQSRTRRLAPNPNQRPIPSFRSVDCDCSGDNGPLGTRD